jgi:long-subunit acyl-CoA synthetase (AMP-forming)
MRSSSARRLAAAKMVRESARPMAVHEGPALAEVHLRSLPQMIAERAALDPKRVAIKQRDGRSPQGGALKGKWQELTWGELDAQRKSVAAGLASLGVKRGDVVATIAFNSSEMLIAELAAQTLGAAIAAVFPNYAQDTLLHCVADSGARVALAGSAAQQLQLTGAKQIEKIVVLDNKPLPEERALPLQALQGAGSVDQPAASRDDLAFVLYTSGTTGKPKGVELTHWNALSQQVAIASLWDVNENDVFLSYLPWHHCFGSLFERLMALWHRALLVLDDSRGRDLDRLFANFAEHRPTVYFGVPRVYNGMIARAGQDPRAREALKGLRFAFSAAAPISEPAFRWFESIGVPVLEGWGLTETSPCVTITRRQDTRAPGMVGRPLPGTAVRVEPLEGMHGRGEILVRGPQVMRGYRNRPAETSRALEEGWLHSGDLGEWTSNGLKLAGRIDGVFKLENGEKVSSGEVEARVLAATPLIEQAVALGYSQSFVTALCWIAPTAAERFLRESELDVPNDPAALAQVPELRRAIVAALQAGNLLTVVPYERVRRIALIGEPPTLESGELTPTMKMVLGVVTTRYADLIAKLRSDQPDPRIVEIIRTGGAFEHA